MPGSPKRYRCHWPPNASGFGIIKFKAQEPTSRSTYKEGGQVGAVLAGNVPRFIRNRGEIYIELPPILLEDRLVLRLESVYVL